MYKLKLTPTNVELKDLSSVPDIGRLYKFCQRKFRRRRSSTWSQCSEKCSGFAHQCNVQGYNRLLQSLTPWPVGFPGDTSLLPGDEGQVDCFTGETTPHEIRRRKLKKMLHLKYIVWYYTGIEVAGIHKRVAAHEAKTIPSSSTKIAQIDGDETEVVVTYSPYMLEMDGYFLSYFMGVLNSSELLRTGFYTQHAAWDTFPKQNQLSLIIQLRKPIRHYIDIIGNDIVNTSVNEKIETEHALSWLSTLGGAFSALGDLSSSFAVEAGRVTLAQLQIAMNIGDPLITSRCHLYAALSLLQLGHLRAARKIISRIYTYAKSLPPDLDPRLRRMCLGVWAKLKYTYSLRKERKRNGKKEE